MKDYYCAEDRNFSIGGLLTNPVYKYAEFYVNIKSNVISNDTLVENLAALLQETPIRANLYYIDSSIDVNDIYNPVRYFVNSWYTYIDVFSYKKINLDFMKSPFIDDKSLFFYNDEPLYNMKFHTGRDYGYYMRHRTSKNADYANLCRMYIRSNENIKRVHRQYQKVNMFIASVSSISSGFLIFFAIVTSIINRFWLSKFLINKIVNYKEDIHKNETIMSIFYNMMDLKNFKTRIVKLDPRPQNITPNKTNNCIIKNEELNSGHSSSRRKIIANSNKRLNLKEKDQSRSYIELATLKNKNNLITELKKINLTVNKTIGTKKKF